MFPPPPVRVQYSFVAEPSRTSAEGEMHLGSRILFLSCFSAVMPASATSPQTLGKGHRIILEHGIQLHGMVSDFDPFHLDTWQDLGFTAVHFFWDSQVSWLGPAPGIPWCRWARSPAETPPIAGEAPYMPQMLALQIGDEQDLNDAGLRANTAAWFDSIRSRFPDTVLYCNSYGGQLTNPSLDDFIRTSRPDMLSFDTYPFRPGVPGNGSPTNLYGDMQRYRKFALASGLPYAMYTQTFHDATVRDASESELRLEYFAGLAFGYTWFNCFTYNSGATSLFSGPGDSNPTATSAQLRETHRRVRILGPTMIRLLNTDVRFINGQSMGHDGKPVSNPTPIDVLNWQFGVSDPWLRGWTVTNTGTKNNGLPGDVWLAWFKPLDESFDGPQYTGEIYMMVVNGLSAPTGAAADCRQEVRLNFGFGTSGITAVRRLRQDTGELERIELPVIEGSGGRRRLTLQLDGGTGELFKFDTTAPFIGVDPPDLTPPASVSPFTAMPAYGRVILSWRNPADPDVASTMIRRKTGGFPVDRNDGQLIADRPATPGSFDTVQDTGLANGTTVYYAAFARDIHGNDAAPATASATPHANGDFDFDGDADQENFAFLQRCFSGPDFQVPPGCSMADMNADGVIDGLDAALLMTCMNGANLPPGC